MKLINVAAAALNQTPLDWIGNITNIRNAIATARERHVSILCLPELAITGYGCEDTFLSADVQNRAVRILQELVPETKGIVVAVGLPIHHNGAIYNCVCLIANQQILGFVAKNNLAGDGIHYEPRWFKAWPKNHYDELRIDDQTYPIGNLVFDLQGVRIGFEICEDAWVANRPGQQLSQAAVDIILNPSASHFAFGKQEVRRRLVLESSRGLGVTYVYANLLGNEAGRVIYDGATLITSGGEIVAEGARLSFSDYVVTTATVDIELTRMSRARLASFLPTQLEPDCCIRTDFNFPTDFNSPKTEPTINKKTVASWETSPFIKEEEFSRAVALGLYDYLRKSRSHGFVISLSGGADSSAVAVLVWLLVQFGIQEIGLAAFLKKLGHIHEIQHLTDSKAIVEKLLTCVYQATKNSTKTTEEAASILASGIGAQYFRLDIDPIVEAYLDEVSTQLGRQLNWNDDDIALQNIQARTRAPGVWLIANVKNALLLATSNRSEAAVGYATMDGDTCGGLSPIAGIDKAFLRTWLNWMFEHGPDAQGSLEELRLVICQTPTAELRPQEAGQTDEDDLMPYELLDWIERAAIRDKQSPVDIFRKAIVEFPQYLPEQISVWTKRFFRLWARNQWKRERYAPSFHLDDENLDPKTWCRFPILSGGFEQELTEIR